MPLPIGIIGSGVVGQTLAAGFAKLGHNVIIGTSDPDKLSQWKKGIKKGQLSIGSFTDAARHGEILILAVRGSAAETALATAGHANLNGKTVIDATNPIDDLPPENGVLRFFTTLDRSLMEILQTKVRKANFVKAFNSVGNALMINPKFAEGRPSMFICGNNSDAKKDVIELLENVGWDAEDMGGAEAARAIEPLCMLWCIPGLTEGRWNHAFKLLKR